MQPEPGQKKQFVLRINQQLWEELNRWASDELRSINGQIEYILRGAVEQRNRTRERAESASEEDM